MNRLHATVNFNIEQKYLPNFEISYVNQANILLVRNPVEFGIYFEYNLDSVVLIGLNAARSITNIEFMSSLKSWKNADLSFSEYQFGEIVFMDKNEGWSDAAVSLLNDDANNLMGAFFKGGRDSQNAVYSVVCISRSENVFLLLNESNCVVGVILRYSKQGLFR